MIVDKSCTEVSAKAATYRIGSEIESKLEECDCGITGTDLLAANP